MQKLNLVRHKNGKDKDIGKTLASDRFPNTMDSFWFSINPDVIINPFDFVTVKHIFNTRTIGMVKELRALEDVGTAARVAIMANTGIENNPTKTIAIGMPVGAAKPVRFADQKEVIIALGIPEMQNPIPAGIIKRQRSCLSYLTLISSRLKMSHIFCRGEKTVWLTLLLCRATQRHIRLD